MSSVTDKDMAEAREILGDLVKDWTDEYLKNELVKMKYLMDSWLDDFERKTFDGQTLAEKIPGFNSYKIREEMNEDKKW